MRPPDPRRQAALAAGRRAETLALWWLRLKGFRLLARDWRCGRGEIDLILRRGRLVIFVEVKQRPTEALARTAITPAQQRRIAAAAELFVAGQPALAGLSLRFDAVLIMPRRWPCHIADAWQIG